MPREEAGEIFNLIKPIGMLRNLFGHDETD